MIRHFEDYFLHLGKRSIEVLFVFGYHEDIRTKEVLK